MRPMLWGAALLAAGTAVSGQGLPKGAFPDGFRVLADGPGDSAAEVVFVTMRPGWHITTGPASILYDGALKADGSFRVDAEIFLFPPGDRNEGYGVFVGGTDLEGNAQTYVAFVIRRSGEFRIERKAGAAWIMVKDWTSHSAIVRYDDKGEGTTAKNILSLDATGDAVRFLVNGAEVANLPRTAVGVDGVVGLRVNAGVNLHVSSLVVTKR